VSLKAAEDLCDSYSKEIHIHVIGIRNQVAESPFGVVPFEDDLIEHPGNRDPEFEMVGQVIGNLKRAHALCHFRHALLDIPDIFAFSYAVAESEIAALNFP